MELKLMSAILCIARKVSSNCTFMELKSITHDVPRCNLGCSNCTFMELKFGDMYNGHYKFSEF